MAETENIAVVADVQELAQWGGRIFIEEAENAIKEKGVFYVAISGGKTPRGVFEMLGQAGSSMWEKVHLFWVDERYVPPNSELSNYALAEETFLSKINMPVENIHRVGTALDDADKAAAVYERTIRRVMKAGEKDVPVMDLVLLGMGADGHTASIFPGDAETLLSKRLVCSVKKAGEKFKRITLTPKILRHARSITVLVSGQEKSRTLAAVMAGEGDEVRYPIRVIWPVMEKVTWVVDRACVQGIERGRK